MIRPATAADIPALTDIEIHCFDIDRLSERSFRHLLTRGNAVTLVEEEQGALRGYAMVLFHRNTSIARMYSLAVDPGSRGKGIGKKLIEAVEAIALGRGMVSMRLEVHTNNSSAQALYRSLGYREFATLSDYYEDHGDALRFEKELAPHLSAKNSPVPFYAQTLEFTCGPACLMMAMKSLSPKIKLDRILELRLWRESTSIFMTSGHGGCSPYGLALSARQRGYQVTLFVRRDPEMFVESVRSEEKREVIRIVQGDFIREIGRSDIQMRDRPLTSSEMEKHFRSGAIPIVLISSYRFTGDKSPHWVVVTGFDERFIYIHEPYVDVEEGETDTTCIGIPIPRNEFEHMTRYGKSRQYAALLITRKEENA
ncbi:MAG: GNAT family N-acetyltransferase/peptidase C39 family protein [Mariprofundaceae bacterium]|nr:GNAT family N-acetyltransferase/peptidase C39 family protein [Mariprofundaceae bacterium]